MKISDLLMALRFLDVEEADEEWQDILHISITPGAMRVETRARNDEGFPFIVDEELATNVKVYVIEVDEPDR